MEEVQFCGTFTFPNSKFTSEVLSGELPTQAEVLGVCLIDYTSLTIDLLWV